MVQALLMLLMMILLLLLVLQLNLLLIEVMLLLLLFLKLLLIMQLLLVLKLLLLALILIQVMLRSVWPRAEMIAWMEISEVVLMLMKSALFREPTVKEWIARRWSEVRVVRDELAWRREAKVLLYLHLVLMTV